MNLCAAPENITAVHYEMYRPTTHAFDRNCGASFEQVNSFYKPLVSFHVGFQSTYYELSVSGIECVHNLIGGKINPVASSERLLGCIYKIIQDDILSKMTFYPRDSMLARYWLRPCLCYKSVFYRNGWTDRAGFWHGSFFRPLVHRVLRKFSYLQNTGTSVWNFFETPDLENFTTAYRSSKRVVNLARERWSPQA